MNDEMGVVSKMRKIILIIFSFCLIHSSQSLAGVGDVYYCTTSNNVTVTAKKVERYKEERFSFKRTGKKLIWEKGFIRSSLDSEFDDGSETFRYKNNHTKFYHQSNGKFMYVQDWPTIVSVMFGSCSVF
jgi:hypothetical protein